jgi:PAS domain S-box-containing protein
LAKINPYSNPLYVLEELIQALKTDDPEISGALDRIAALTGIQKQALLDTASNAQVSISQINSISDAVVHLNNDLTIRRWNPAAEKIYGFSADEAIGQNIEELLQTEYDIESRQQSLESFQEHGMWSGEIVHRRKDGTRIQVYTRLARTHNSRGLVTGIVSLFRDISGNVSSANLPELMTTRLRTMLKATNEAIWDWDFRTNRHWWSEGIERLFGYKSDEMEPGPESWYNRIHPEDKERIIEGIHLAINGSASYWQDDYKFMKKDGSWAYVIDRGHIIRDESGMAVRMIGGLSDRSEQRRIIYELAYAHRRLSSHLNNSPLAVVEWDADLNMISWNKRAEEIFGWKSGEVIGKNLKIWKFIHNDDDERVKEAMNGLIGGKSKSNVVVNRNYCKDGSFVTCEWYNTALFDNDGNRLSFFSQAHDISGRIQAEEAFMKSQERLALAHRIARIGDWELDLATMKLDWSDEVFSIFGVGRETFDGDYEQAFLSRVHPDDRKSVEETRMRVLESDKPVEVIHRYYRTDGEIRYLYQFGETVRDEKGCPVKVVGTVQDVTELTVARQNLRKSEDMYRTIVDTAREGIWLIDEQGLTTYVNQRLCEILGFTADEMRGKIFLDFTHEDYARQASEGFEERKRGVLENNEIMLRHKDGHGVWINYSANPIYDDDGNFIAALAMITDVSGKKDSDEVIASSLREKQVMLEEIHHRVKNNMQLISSLMQLQAMKVSDESVKTLFDDSHSRILSMALVHENLYEAEDMSLVDFRDYLEKLISNLRNVYPNEGLAIRLETGDIRLAIGRAIPLGLIVNELVTNAMRHAFPEGREGTIMVGLRRVEGDGDDFEGNPQDTRYELVVQDDGIGYRRRGKEGLGLELVDGLVRQIRGEIIFKNKKGTRVEVGFWGIT